MILTASILELAERFRRPSNIGRLAACPGQAIMAAAITAEDGEAPAAPVADLGNQGHHWVHQGTERFIAGAEWGDAIAWACGEAAAAGMDSWSVHCIQTTLEFYRDIIAKYEIERENVLVEHALDMASAGFQRKGTSDLVLVIPFKLIVIVDLKFGFVDQGDAEDHDQMATYAAAAAVTFKAPKVITYLWQPRAERDRRATAAEFDASALRATADWSRATLEASRSPTAELRADFPQCSTCPALRRCAEAKRFIVNVTECLEVCGPPTSPEDWGQAISAAKLAEKWADAWKDAGKAHLVAGGEAVGFKLGTGRAIRTVADVPGAFAKLNEAGMMAEALAAASLTVGKLPPQAADLIRDHITEKVSDPPLVADKRSRAA